MQIEGILFYGFFGLIFVAAVFHSSKRQRQLKRREKSLSYDSTTNAYHWIGISGVSQTSNMHPALPGGEWYEGDRSGNHNGSGHGGDFGGGDSGSVDSSGGSD